MVVQLDKGITTTTMNINMPNSVFNGAQVILDQYSSAPHSYNLQLIGSPEAVKLFTSNMTQLENSFKQANFNFEVNILNPSITQTKKPLTSSVEAVLQAVKVEAAQWAILVETLGALDREAIVVLCLVVGEGTPLHLIAEVMEVMGVQVLAAVVAVMVMLLMAAAARPWEPISSFKMAQH